MDYMYIIKIIKIKIFYTWLRKGVSSRISTRWLLSCLLGSSFSWDFFIHFLSRINLAYPPNLLRLNPFVYPILSLFNPKVRKIQIILTNT